MPWTPEMPNIDFGLPLLENLIVVAERDQTDALAWAAAKTPAVPLLADFVKVLKCERVATHFPALAIYPVGDIADTQNEGASFELRITFGFDVEIAGEKPEALTEELRKRVAAVRQMVVSATMEDLMLNVVGASKLILEFGPGQYEQVRGFVNKVGLYFRSATFTITFRYIQTGG